MTAFVVRYDFRAPGAAPDERREHYARALDQAAYAEEHRLDAITLSEHHATDDGYLPSPLVAAAAIAARTERIPISISALLVNLSDPLRLAEDIAVLDQISAGRVSITLGLGYRPEEYAMFDRPWHSRGRDIESAIQLMLRAWSGEEIEHRGRTVRVSPIPYSRPHPFLFYGGGSEAAARRAARLGLGFAPQMADRELVQLYRAECTALGREPGLVVMPPAGPATVFCSADPDEFWERWGSHLLADARAYDSWHGEMSSYVRDESSSIEELRSSEVYAVLHPDDLIERCRTREIRLVTSHPLCGGMPAEPSWASLRLVCETVLPAVRAQRAG